MRIGNVYPMCFYPMDNVLPLQPLLIVNHYSYLRKYLTNQPGNDVVEIKLFVVQEAKPKPTT